MTSILRILFLTFLLNSQILAANSDQPASEPNFKPLTQQGLAIYPLYRGDEAYFGGLSEELFSQNSRLFVFLTRYEGSLAVIKIWDTLTGELKYQTIAPKEFPLSYDQVFHMQLSPKWEDANLTDV